MQVSRFRGYFLALILLLSISSAWAQSQFPGGAAWVGTSGGPNNGDRDQTVVIFFEIPQSTAGSIYFGINDPGNSGDAANYDLAGTGTSYWSLIGGMGALSDPSSSLLTYAPYPSSQALAGTIISSFTRTNENEGWVYFPLPVNPAWGEAIGDKYYFKVVLRVDGNVGKNGFRADVSTSNAGAPVAVAGAKSFAYGWSPYFSTNLLGPGLTWDFYPFVSYGSTGNIDFKIWDVDNAVDAAAVYDIPPGGDLGYTIASGGSGSSLVQTSSYAIGTEHNGTWHAYIDGIDGGTNNDLCEFWAEIDGVLLRTYSASVPAQAADHVDLGYGGGAVAVGGEVQVSVQAVSAAGAVQLIPQKAWVYVDGAASITAASSTSTSLPASGALVQLDANGLGWVRVKDTVAQTVNVNALTDGSYGSDDLPNVAANTSVALTFSPGPTLSSASSSNFTVVATSALPVLTISNAGSSLTSAALDLLVRVPSSLGLNFSAAAPTVGGTEGALPTFYVSPSVLYINLSAGMTGADTITLSGLQLVVPANASGVGRLELSFDQGQTWSVVDDKTISVDTIGTYTWDGGGGDNDWDTAANWSTDVNPVAGADINIPMGTPRNPVVNTGMPIYGSITIGVGKVVTSGNYGLSANGNVIIDGTLTGGSGAFSFAGSVSGVGTFTASSTSTTIGGNLSVTAFNANGGTVTFNGTGAQSTNAYTFVNLRKTGSSTLSLSASTLTVSGTLTIGSGAVLDLATFNASIGTLSNDGTLALSGTQTVTLGGNDANSGTWRYASVAGLPSIKTFAGSDYFDLAIAGSSTYSLGAALDINGTLSMTSGTLDVSGQALTVGSSVSITGSAALTTNAASSLMLDGAGAVSILTSSSGADALPSLTVGDGTNAKTATLLSAIDVAGGITIASNGTLNANAQTFSVSGSWNNTSGTLSNASALATFSGAAQTIATGGTAAGKTFGPVSVSGSYSLTGSAMQASALSGAGTLTTADQNLAVTGNVSIGTLNATAAGAVELITVGGNFLPTAFAANGATVLLNGATTPVSAGAFAYETLTLGKSAAANVITLSGAASSVTLNATTGTLNLGGALTISGTLTIAANGRVVTGDNNLSAATITESGAGAVLNASGQTTAGRTVSFGTGMTLFAAGFSAGTATTVVSTGTGTLTSAANNLGAFSKMTGGTLGLADALSLTRGLDIAAGTLNANTFNINLGGDWSNSGTFSSGGGAQTVTFNGALAQAIVSGGTSFNNLTVSKGGGTLSLGAATQTAGTFALTGGILSNGTNALTVGGAFSQSAATFFTQGDGVITLNGATNSFAGTFTKAGAGSITFSRLGAQSLSANGQDLGNIAVSGALTVLTIGNQGVTFDAVNVGPGAELALDAVAGNVTLNINTGETLDNQGTVRILNSGTNMASLVGLSGTASFTGADIAWNGQRLTLASILYGQDIALGTATLILGDGANTFQSINAGTGIFNANGQAFSLSGSWNNTSGTLSNATALATFTGAAQTIATGGTGVGKSFGPVSVSGSYSLTGSAMQASALSGAGSLTTADQNLTVTGAVTIAALSATDLGAAETITIGGNFNPTAFDAFDSTVILNGTTTPVSAGGFAYNILTLSKSAAANAVNLASGASIGTLNATTGTLNLGGALAISGTLTIAANGRVVTGDNNLSAASIIESGAGALLNASGQVTAGRTVSFGTSMTLVAAGFNAGTAMTVVSTGTGTLTSATNNLGAFSKTTGGILALADALSITRGLNIAAGTLNANAFNINLGGDWSNAGTFTSGGGAQTVTFNGALAQAIVSGGTSFNNLTVNKAAALSPADTLSVGTIAFQVAGALSILDGQLVQSGDNLANVQSAGSLSVSAGASAIWDSLVDGGTLVIDGNLANAGTLNFNNKDVSIGGTVTGNITFMDLTIPAGKTITPQAASSITVLRHFTIANGGSYVNNGRPLTLGGGAITIGTLQDQNAILQDLGAVSLIAGGGPTVKTLGDSLLASSLDISANVTLAVNDQALSVSGALSGAGTLSALAGGASDAIAVGGSMSVAAFVAENSTLTFNGGVNATTLGYTFWNLVMNMGGPAITLTPSAGIVVSNGFTMTQGDFRAGGFSHSIAGNWDSSPAAVTFNAVSAGTSTITLSTDGATITSKPADRFYGLTLARGATLASGITILDDLVVASAGAGTLNLGGFTLSVAGDLTMTALNAALNAGASTLNLNGTVAQTVATNGVTWNNVSLSNRAAGTVAFNQALNVGAALTVAGPGAYNVSLNDGGSVTNAVSFANSGMTTINTTALETFTFSGGVSATAGPKTLAGTIQTTDAPIDIGTTATTLAVSTILDAGTADVTLAAINGGAPGAQSLTVNSSGAGITSFNGSIGAATPLGALETDAGGTTRIGTLIRTQNATIEFNDNVELFANGQVISGSAAIDFYGTVSDDPGSWILTLQENVPGATGPVSFHASVTLNDLVTFGQSYGVGLLAGGTIDQPVDFLNAGMTVLGDGAADNLLFSLGVRANAGPKTLGGTIRTTNAAIDFDSSATTLGANAFLESGSGLIGLQDISDGASSYSLTLHANAAGSTGTVSIAGAATIDDLVTYAQPYAITMLGGADIAQPVSFLNTGNVTLGDALADDFLFRAGLSSTASGTNAFWGTVRTSGGAGQDITLDDLSLGGVLTLNAGASGVVAFTGTVSVSNASGDADVLVIAPADIDLSISAALIDAAGASAVLSIASLATVDIGSSNFQIDEIVNGAVGNPGVFRLSGQQTTHTVATFDVDSGITEYYGAAPGSVLASGLGAAGNEYWDLRIASNAGVAKSLNGDIEVLKDVHIQSGVLDASPGNRQITIYGNWRNDVGHAGFVPRLGTARFAKPSGAIDIYGNNTWYIFHCTIPGVTIRFENTAAAITQRIAVGGVFRVRGSAMGAGTQVNLTRLSNTGDPQPYPDPPLVPGDDNKFWFFDLTPGASLDMAFVEMWYSNARANPVGIPPDVLAGYFPPGRWDFKWLDKLYALYSYTEDSDYNGKLDRLRITTESAIGNDFSDFEIEVEGYDIDRTKGTNGYERPLPGVSLYVYLEEKPYLDTDATPRWRVLTLNPSLRDEATGSQMFGTLETGTTDYMTPGDTAWPIIAYALSLPSNDGTFVRFSEPVVTLGGGALAAGDFGAGAFALVSGTAPETLEALVNRGAYGTGALVAGATAFPVTATTKDTGLPPLWDPAYDVLYPGAPEPTYPPATGYLANPNTYAPYGAPPDPGPLTRPDFAIGGTDRDADGTVDNQHRVSDLLISIEPTPTVALSWSALNADSWFAWPIWAKDETAFPGTSAEYEALTPAEAASQTLGLVRAFNSTQWLRDQDWDMKLRTNPTLGIGSAPTLLYDSNAAPRLLSAVPGIWLPAFSETDYSGLAAYPSADYSTKAGSGVAPDWDYAFAASDGEVFSGANFDFWLRLPGAPADLYAGRLDMASGAAVLPPDWYRRVRPFQLGIRDVTPQKGGVTILNNVIDPGKGERVRLNYTLTERGQVTVLVFTLDGDVVRALYRGTRDPGDYTDTWDGTNLSGRDVARGAYFIRVVGPGIDEIRKVLVVKTP